MKPADVLVTSDESHMRAYDYRAVDGLGIALFIDKPLSCKRTLIQALGRVGRYGEPCRRFIRTGMKPIDAAENAKINMRISEKIEEKLSHAKLQARRQAKQSGKKVNY